MDTELLKNILILVFLRIKRWDCGRLNSVEWQAVLAIFVFENWHKLKSMFLVGSTLESKYYKDEEPMRIVIAKRNSP